MQNENAALAIDGGDLAIGAGLLALFRPALDLLEPGGVLAVNSVNRALRDDLPRWCQLQHHEYREHVSPPEVANLYDQAIAAQWNANTDIPWHKTRRLPDAIERALGQVFTFLAENDLSALYLPSKFIARIHPAFVETAMFLSTQMADEARHIDVFLKRAPAGGDPVECRRHPGAASRRAHRARCGEHGLKGDRGRP